jgi:hypothetical protein
MPCFLEGMLSEYTRIAFVLFKIIRIGSGITLSLSAAVSVISYSAEINFLTDKSTGL